jgi:hypothetical protein
MMVDGASMRLPRCGSARINRTAVAPVLFICVAGGCAFSFCIAVRGEPDTVILKIMRFDGLCLTGGALASSCGEDLQSTVGEWCGR